jgi:RNA polymerase sigma-70 factor (ECF subfamily)
VDGCTGDLLEKFRAGDGAAYAALWRRYLVALRSFLRHLLAAGRASELAVEDLLQDTHVEALRSLASFEYRRELSFFFWLCGIARRLVASQRRRSARRARLVPVRRWSGAPSSVELLAGAARTGPGDQLELREHLDLLALGLEQLDERRREAILLRYVEELDGDQAAAALGTTPGAFRVLLARALGDLRRSIDQLRGVPDERLG